MRTDKLKQHLIKAFEMLIIGLISGGMMIIVLALDIKYPPFTPSNTLYYKF